MKVIKSPEVVIELTHEEARKLEDEISNLELDRKSILWKIYVKL